MKNRTIHIIKYLCLALVLALLLLPALQSKFEFITIRPLFGGFLLTEKPSLDSLSSKTWFSGQFQGKYSRSVEEHIGFRNFFIRLNNQINYSFYRVSENPNIVIGKSDCLFEEGYILAYLGRNFIGEKPIHERMQRAKWVQDYFREEKNIDIIFIFAPSKGSYHAEYIPARYRPQVKAYSNYDCFSQYCRDNKVRHIDFHRDFLSMKDSAQHPLYPRYGVHWSKYGMTLATDSIVRYIEGLRNIDLPDFDRSEVTYSDQFKDVDADWDAEQALNLMFRLPLAQMAYPQIRYDHDTVGKTRPRVLAVADSYYWSIYNSGIPQHCFGQHTLWYYYFSVYPFIWDFSHLVSALKVKEEIEKQDVILVMATEMNLYRAWWQFTDDLYRWYNPEFREDPLYNTRNDVINQDMWLREHIIKAKKMKCSVEQAINSDAAGKLTLP